MVTSKLAYTPSVESLHSAVVEAEGTSSWWPQWLRWNPTSLSHLRLAEETLLRHIKLKYDGSYTVINKAERIWTLIINPEASEKNGTTPIVLVHEMGCGVGLWVLNLDGLATKRTVYAFDLLGFGRSSRPTFSCDPLEAESEFVESIEDWRAKHGLERFVLLGHGLGGYLCASYAMQYPEHVQHLVLVDPWGFGVKPPDYERSTPIPTWIRVVAVIVQTFNPLAGLRVAGPFGPTLVQKIRPDLIKKFRAVTDGPAICDYIYHCNAQHPSGEAAYRTMALPHGWAKNPMVLRIDKIDSAIPITFIYGARSWIDSAPGDKTKELRKTAHVDVQVLPGAGHHVYADKPDEFNAAVSKLMEEEDRRNSPNEDAALA